MKIEKSYSIFVGFESPRVGVGGLADVGLSCVIAFQGRMAHASGLL
jgi:hypothetical protein